MDFEKLPRVCICRLYKECKDLFRTYVEEKREDITYVNKRYPYMIRLHNGDEIYFMTDITYSSWCLGRTYRFYDDERAYHSGYPTQI